MALKRELAAAVAIPIVLAILFFAPALVFNLLVAAVALAALWEFYRIAERTGHPAAKTIGIAASAGALVVGALSPSNVRLEAGSLRVLTIRSEANWLVFFVTLALLAAVAPLFSRLEPSAALASAGATVFGVTLIALPALSLCSLRQYSPRAVLFLLLIVWSCDSFAYYTGKNFGRRKLAPVISPNKTWEGTIGGLVGATLVGAIGGTWWLLPELGSVRGALAGALASTAGQIGDLVESMWKRGAGVKDSGVFLPGHGGFYDRIDSLLFAGPVLAAFVAALS